MLKAFITALALAMPLLVVGNLSAQVDKESKPPDAGPDAGKDQKDQDVVDRLDKIKGLNLTAEQKAKLEQLQKEYVPKRKMAAEKVDSVLTAAQKQARDKAVKRAKAARKKPLEIAKAGYVAMRLTNEQRTTLAEALKSHGQLVSEIRAKVLKILTPEQVNLLKKRRKEKERAEHGPTQPASDDL
jgi:Spy/CpxP family protein refolding chaperone